MFECVCVRVFRGCSVCFFVFLHVVCVPKRRFVAVVNENQKMYGLSWLPSRFVKLSTGNGKYRKITSNMRNLFIFEGVLLHFILRKKTSFFNVFVVF